MFLLVFLIAIAYSTVLTITQPALKIPDSENNTIPVNIADFGYVPYGRTVKGNIIFVNNSCYPLNYSLSDSVAISFTQNCTFLSQAMNAQKAGAKMLILIDSQDEDISKYILIAEHSQEQSFIPTIMIEKIYGDFIRNQLDTLNQNITVSIYFELHQKEIVELRYFLTTFDYNSYEFLYEFWPFAQQIFDKINFEPIYVQFYCKECAQQGYQLTTSECISGGRYCAYDPDNEGPLTGRDVVLEDLRQLCIFQTQNLTKWWNYMILFYQVCFKDYENCPNKIMKSITINVTEIDNCMDDSFEGSNHLLADNKILRNEQKKIQKNHFVYWPSLNINGDFYKGDLYLAKQGDDLFTVDDFAVLEAICDGFTDDSRPAFCNSTGFFSINEGEIKEQQSSILYVLIWVGVGLFVFFLLFGTFLLYRRHLMKQMKNDVNSQIESSLKEYYKMEEAK